MDATNVLKGVLGIVSLLYPPAAPVIGIIEAAAPYIALAVPLIEEGIKEGPGAFKAAQEAAPELASAIQSIADHALSLGRSFGSTNDAHVENITRAIFGHPQMSFDEELKWMNDTTSLLDDSRLGSG